MFTIETLRVLVEVPASYATSLSDWQLKRGEAGLFIVIFLKMRRAR